MNIDELGSWSNRSSSFVPFQSEEQPSKTILPEQLLVHYRARQKTEAFAEVRAATKAIELRIAGQRAQLQLFDAEEVTQLRMLAVKNRAGLSHRVLPPGERVDAHAVIVASDRRGVVSDAQPSSIQPIRQLDVFPGRRRERR